MSRIAAIWARVSTPEQMSLKSQIIRAKAKLEAEGYTIPPERILAVDWTSLDLFSCPEFQRLREWIGTKEIEAIGVLDRDRLEATPVQRVLFLTLCKKAAVELVVCQGPPVIDDQTGQLVEFALAWSKEVAVVRAKQGAKDGLHDRAITHRLPTSHHKVFGYKWAGKTPEELRLSRKLVPNENRGTLGLIFDMLLKGASYDAIIKEFKERGILSPAGEPEWNKSALSAIAHNPIYAGRYYALKKQAVEPKKRKGKTYGNSSQRQLPLEQAIYLPEIEIVDPPITWEQRLQILDQLEKHQKLARRNGRADYLLRGFIFCNTHRGKKGEPRRYHGQPHGKNSRRYVCPVGGCTYPYLNGPKIEEWVKGYTKILLMLEAHEFYECICRARNRGELEQSLQRELRGLEAKYNRSINAETELENRNLLGLEHEEVYRRLKVRFRAERQWIEEREQNIREELAQLDRETEAFTSLQEIVAKFGNRLDELTKAEWRELFTALNLEVHIRHADDPSWPDKWPESGKLVSDNGLIEFCFGLPLKATQIGEIVLTAPKAA